MIETKKAGDMIIVTRELPEHLTRMKLTYQEALGLMMGLAHLLDESGNGFYS